MKTIFTIIIFLTLLFKFAFPEVVAQTPTETRKAKAYIGVVTDKTGNSLQIKNDNSEFAQISVTIKTTYAKFPRTSASINFNDIAIGDYIVAMGYVDANQVLDALRILQSSQEEKDERRAIIALVSLATRKEVVVKDVKTNIEYIIKPATKISVTYSTNDVIRTTQLSSLEEGDKLIVSGIKNGNSIEARKIHVIPTTTETLSPAP